MTHKPFCSSVSEVSEQVCAELIDVTVKAPMSNKVLLSRVNWQIKAGEQWMVLGPSGAGKSTILHLLIGLMPHVITVNVTGEVKTFGRSNLGLSICDIANHVGWLNQDPFTSVCLPIVEQEVAMGLENKAVAAEEIENRVIKALSAVGLLHLRYRQTTSLSGGECQRIALAAIIAGQSRLILYDEPTAMLDPSAIAHVRSILRQSFEDKTKSVVLVEHRLDELAGEEGLNCLPSHTLVLSEEGRVLGSGQTKETLIANAASFHQNGIWLPLELELLAHTGHLGGFESQGNRHYLDKLAYTQPDSLNDLTLAIDAPSSIAHASAPRPPVLSVNNLTVIRSGEATSHAYVNHAMTSEPQMCATNKQNEKNTQTVIFDGLTFSIYQGERVAVLGNNGAGKSTLLMALAGLLANQKEILLKGDIHSQSVGMIFQNPEYQFLANTVIDEVSYGIPPSKGAVIDETLRQFRLAHLASQNPYKLSGGEKRRLSLAAMSLHDRSILLADEPTFGLDRRDTFMIMNELCKLSKFGKTLLFSSHDLRLIATYATRIFVLKNGKIMADGSPYDILGNELLCDSLEIITPPFIKFLFSQYTQEEVTRILFRLEQMTYANQIKY